MRRIQFLLLGVSLFLGTLAGCADKTTNKTEKTVSTPGGTTTTTTEQTTKQSGDNPPPANR